jgi:hypothetical protein
LIDTMAMIGSAAGRGAVIWVGCAAAACLAAAGGASNAVSAAMAESATMAADPRKPAARTRVDRAGILRLVIPFLG